MAGAVERTSRRTGRSEEPVSRVDPVIVRLAASALWLAGCSAIVPDLSNTSATADSPSTSGDVGSTAIGLTNVSGTDSATSGPGTRDSINDAKTGDAGTGAASTGGSSASEPVTTETTESSGPEPDAGTETGGSVCDPARGDDECSLCMKERCCPEVVACEANPDCVCLIACIDEMGIGAQQACLVACLVEIPPAEVTVLQTCVATSGCLATCL